MNVFGKRLVGYVSVGTNAVRTRLRKGKIKDNVKSEGSSDDRPRLEKRAI